VIDDVAGREQRQDLRNVMPRWIVIATSSPAAVAGVR
jgi:hypothetical protein